ncbi:MAG: hypothetical protein LBT40_15355 [Deltaproteobacteria bacterium]|jgi:hypothetical protein|nr:hypothetical protein [Deltaproteobacteria bacterium]
MKKKHDYKIRWSAVNVTRGRSPPAAHLTFGPEANVTQGRSPPAAHLTFGLGRPSPRGGVRQRRHT